MKNKYVIITLLALLASEVPAQRLLVNITIDQLHAVKMMAMGKTAESIGFRQLLEKGLVYDHATFPFEPVDQASAIAALTTGTTPFYNGITGLQWLDTDNLRPKSCVADNTPQAMVCSNLSDELKIATGGNALVFSIANDKETAILSAGHAANGAFWRDKHSHRWTSSTYHSKEGYNWLSAFNSLYPETDNANIVRLALQCMDSHLLGRDEVCDILSVSFTDDDYTTLDRCVNNLLKGIEQRIGAGQLIVSLSGTLQTDEPFSEAYQQQRVPSGTFFINRTGELLNMYLGAIYGRQQYIEGYFRNHIFMNRKLIEQRHINRKEFYENCRSFLRDCDGVKNVQTATDLLPPHSGDLVIEIKPGWNLLNEQSGERFQSRLAYRDIPIIIYGQGIKAQRITTPVTIDRLAPTLAGCIHIRAPNACKAQPLFNTTN